VVDAQTVRLHGIIEDSLSRDKLYGATITLKRPSGKSFGASSNRYGFYALKTATDTYTISVSYVGYKTKVFLIEILSDTILNLYLSPVINQLQEVTVQSQNQLADPIMGYYHIPLTIVKQAPALLGESDAMKIIQSLPGVQSGTEGTAGLHVRGGSPDQNLILLDGMPVYNAFHLFGFYSVFNTDALHSVDFYKSSIPARYGGRLSSVIDIAMKEGSLTKPHHSFSLSPIAGSLLAEGPIKKGVASYILSARRTWSDLITGLFFKATGPTSVGYNFDDINAKINVQQSSRSHLYFSIYRGRDRFNSVFRDGNNLSRFQFNWGNYTSTIRYTKVYGKQIFGSFQAGYVGYSFQINNQYRGDKVDYFSRTASRISDMTIKSDFNWTPIDQHQLRFGSIVTRHRFEPDIRQYKGDSLRVEKTSSTAINSTEIGVYIEDEWSVSKKITANIGYHQSANLTQNRWYVNPQPRLSISYLLNENRSIKASYNYLAQYLHLLTNASLGLPTDLWVPTTSSIAPQLADQLSIGYYQRSTNGKFYFSLEGYYKRMQNVLEYKEGATFLNDQDSQWYERVVTGQGRSYGLEVYLQKTSGKLTGWLSYTLSKNERLFSELNQSNWFPYKYDRRHNINVLTTYNVSKNRQLTANFVFTSGNPATIATSIYQGISPPALTSNLLNYEFYSYYQGLEDISQRNNFRLPAYHRLDVSYKFTKVKRKGTRSWLLSCYNIYNRKNPFFVFYQNGTLKQFTLFTIIPAFAYHYDF
jgi:hypothetical protein